MISHDIASRIAYELGVDFNCDDVAWGAMSDTRRVEILSEMFPGRRGRYGVRIEFSTLQTWVETLKAGGHPEVPYSPNNSEMAAWAAEVAIAACRDVLTAIESELKVQRLEVAMSNKRDKPVAWER